MSILLLQIEIFPRLDRQGRSKRLLALGLLLHPVFPNGSSAEFLEEAKSADRLDTFRILHNQLRTRDPKHLLRRSLLQGKI